MFHTPCVNKKRANLSFEMGTLCSVKGVYSGTWPPNFSEISSHLTDIEQRIVSTFLRHGVPMLVPTSRLSDKSHYIEKLHTVYLLLYKPML